MIKRAVYNIIKKLSNYLLCQIRKCCVEIILIVLNCNYFKIYKIKKIIK